MHVDGAFGLWAAAVPSLRHLVAGVERADSWATDAHKWLNVPYDCGIALCAHPAHHEAAMEYAAPYLHVSDQAAIRDPMGYSPEFSRRARAAARLGGDPRARTLGDRRARRANAARTRARFAERIAALPGCEVLNEVVLNQVLFRFADDATTRAALAAVQAGGEAWMSGTVWDGRRGDPPLRLELADDRGGCRPHRRGVRRAAR